MTPVKDYLVKLKEYDASKRSHTVLPSTDHQMKAFLKEQYLLEQEEIETYYHGGGDSGGEGGFERPPMWWSLYGDLNRNWSEEYGASSVYDESGNLYVLGTYRSEDVTQALLVKYDSYGAVIWSKVFRTGNVNTYGESLCISGNVLYILLNRDASFSVAWYRVLQLNLNGQIISQIEGDYSENINAIDIAVDHNSNAVYVLCDNAEIQTSSNIQVIFKLNMSTQTVVWAREITAPNSSAVVETSQPGTGYGAIRYHDGSVYATGAIYYNSANYAWAAKLDAVSGDALWVTDFALSIDTGYNAAGCVGMGICVDEQGNSYITTTANDETGSSVITKFNTAGVFQWYRVIMGLQGGGEVSVNYKDGFVYGSGSVYDQTSLGPVNGQFGAIFWSKIDATTGDIVFENMFGYPQLPLDDVRRFKGHSISSIYNDRMSIAAYAFESVNDNGIISPLSAANMLVLQVPLVSITDVGHPPFIVTTATLPGTFSTELSTVGYGGGVVISDPGIKYSTDVSIVSTANTTIVALDSSIIYRTRAIIPSVYGG